MDEDVRAAVIPSREAELWEDTHDMRANRGRLLRHGDIGEPRRASRTVRAEKHTPCTHTRQKAAAAQTKRAPFE